jgi:hypothetical protein
MGIDVLKVQKIIRFQEMTRAVVTSFALINLRDQIVRHRCDALKWTIAREGCCRSTSSFRPMTGRHAGGQIGDVLEVSEEAFEPPPETSRNGRQSSRHKLDHRLLLLLDTERFFRPAAKNSTSVKPGWSCVKLTMT